MDSTSHRIDVAEEPVAAMDRLGDEIAELSAHLEAATARLLDLIREFDIKGGWNNAFRSCAAWLSWKEGLDLGAARAARGGDEVKVGFMINPFHSLSLTPGAGQCMVSACT